MRPRADSLPLLALLPLLFLTGCLCYVLIASFTEPLPPSPVPDPTETDSRESASSPSSDPPTETEPEENLHQSRLPILLSSASDLPPAAAEIYDILFATDPTLPEFPVETPSVQPLPADEVPEGGNAILVKNLSRGEGNALKYLSNKTKYKPDLEALAAMKWEGDLPVFSQTASKDEPIVLIYHSHATESYLPEDATYIDENTVYRSPDPEKNMIAVGAVLVEVLEQAGIPTVHCQVMHDKESYNDSYSNARKSVVSYLERYPSIRYVLDVHRDAIITADGDHVRPITTVNGRQAAQIMFVIGTDEAGAKHPDWQTNLSLACKLQLRLSENIPDFVRPINLRSSSFLAQYSDGAMLLEVGSAANTLSQAKYAAQLFGEQLAALIHELGGV